MTLRLGKALTPLFGNGAGAHGIGKISGVLTKIGKFDGYISEFRKVPQTLQDSPSGGLANHDFTRPTPYENKQQQQKKKIHVLKF